MKQFEEAIKLHHTLTGEDMSPEDIKMLLAVKAGVGIPDNDSLFSVFIALGYWLQMYRQIPVIISDEKSSFEKMLEDGNKKLSSAITEYSEQTIKNSGLEVIKHYQDVLKTSKKDALEEQKAMFNDAAKSILESNAKKINESNSLAYNKLFEIEKSSLQHTYGKTLFIAALIALSLLFVGFIGGKYSERIGQSVKTDSTLKN